MTRTRKTNIATSIVLLPIVLTLGACSGSQKEPEVNEPEVTVLSEQDLVDILIGSCIQSTRGCDPAPSIESVKQALAEGREFRMISTENFPDDGMVVAVQGLGGGGALAARGYPGMNNQMARPPAMTPPYALPPPPHHHH